MSDIPRVYLKALSMAQFDPFLLTHGSDTRVDVKDLSERIIGKRKFGKSWNSTEEDFPLLQKGFFTIVTGL